MLSFNHCFPPDTFVLNITVALLSVVSSQTFNRRSRFRSGNFRRFQDDGALDENGGSVNGGASNGGAANGFSSQLTDETPAPQYGGSEQAALDGKLLNF